MRILETKTFARWARKEGITDRALADAVAEIELGLVEARLGGDVFKKRVARRGEGKRGAYRTILGGRRGFRWIFLLGFAKSERSDIDEDELRALRRIAQAWLGMDDPDIDHAVEAGELHEVHDG